MIISKELAYRLKVLCDTATTDESRLILTTVHVEAHAERAFFVAIDGFRISVVCLPIETETEEVITLQIDAKMFKKLLGAKVDLTITLTGLNISGMSLPSLDIGLYPDWRAIIPHNTEPRANIAAFMLKYTIDFLKFRLGRNYNKTTGTTMTELSPSSMLLHYSIYDGDSCGMASPHCWTWAEPYGANYNEDDVVYYLHVLMPMRSMETGHICVLDDDENEERKKAFQAGNEELARLLAERFTSKITNVTGPIVDEVWGRPKKVKGNE